jgi:hypothetical protein
VTSVPSASGSALHPRCTTAERYRHFYRERDLRSTELTYAQLGPVGRSMAIEAMAATNLRGRRAAWQRSRTRACRWDPVRSGTRETGYAATRDEPETLRLRCSVTAPCGGDPRGARSCGGVLTELHPLSGALYCRQTRTDCWRRLCTELCIFLCIQGRRRDQSSPAGRAGYAVFQQLLLILLKSPASGGASVLLMCSRRGTQKGTQ